LDFDNISEDFNQVIKVNSIEKTGINYNTEKAIKAKSSGVQIKQKNLDLNLRNLSKKERDDHYN